jgi:hypothetical protein
MGRPTFALLALTLLVEGSAMRGEAQTRASALPESDHITYTVPAPCETRFAISSDTGHILSKLWSWRPLKIRSAIIVQTAVAA